LALHDAGSSGKLHPSTRAALDRMWKVQRENGSWDWLKCNWPPMEHDDFYGAALAAVGVAMAPEKYAQGDSSKEGIARLRKYLASTPAPSLHHQAHLLWAASKLDGLLTREQQKQTIKDLLDKQRADGGWSLASLGDWKGYDGRDNDPNAPSDGYGTGLVVLVLRQAGLPVDHPAIARGSRWLRENQRVSGRWYTRSLNKDAAHFITNAGTAFAVMALKACDS
ncbi:MAG: squalene--hopene cyclase, partial [Gemmataceae bacterium]